MSKRQAKIGTRYLVRVRCVKSCPALCHSVDVAHQASLSMGFPRQECWSGLPLSTPGDLPEQGLNLYPLSPPALVGGFFTTEPPGKPEMPDTLVKMMK